MMEMQGVSTDLPVFLSRFLKLTRVCYYDNACNMLQPIIDSPMGQ